ncbi:MAG: thioredoxin TrxA [Candidatus Dasytiphilus stammeri]
MTNKIIHLTDDNFEEKVLKSPIVTLVDFWAPWCGPCKGIAPILNEIADEYYGKLTIAKLNVDENPKITEKYAIRGIPTLLIFRNGQIIATKVGTVSKKEIKNLFEPFLIESS